MSVPVALTELAERIAERGDVAYVISVGADDRPHVVSARLEWEDDELVTGAGQRTSANVASRPHVTLLWSAPPGSGYCLIVDGAARVRPEGLAIAPTSAVLHRTPEGDPSAPSCVTVLSPAG